MALSFMTSNVIFFCKQKEIVSIGLLYSHLNKVRLLKDTSIINVKCMLISSRLEKGFWVEEIYASTYLLNRSPSSFVDLKLHRNCGLENHLTCVTLEYLDILHMHTKLKKKLDPKTIKCVMLRYPERVNGNMI